MAVAARRLRRQDWAFYASVVSLVAAGLVAGTSPLAAGGFVGTAMAATIAAKVVSRRRPEPLPYAQRWMLALTRPFFPAWALRKALKPRQGQRIVEIGPGTGRHALAIAADLGAEGRLDIIDIQASMIEAVVARAARRGVTNVHGAVGDAHQLPWPEATFDRAYLVTVLGEIPDRPPVLAELRRVLRPGGRIVVGEMLLDPDNVPLPALRREAEQAGLREVRITRGPLTYLAELEHDPPFEPSGIGQR